VSKNKQDPTEQDQAEPGPESQADSHCGLCSGTGRVRASRSTGTVHRTVSTLCPCIDL
jgi:DnaJ-class molecular chaperone